MERGHERSYDSGPFGRPASSGKRRDESTAARETEAEGAGGAGGAGDGSGIGQVQEACTIGIKVCRGAVAQERRTRRVRETGSASVRVICTRVCTRVRDVDSSGGGRGGRSMRRDAGRRTFHRPLRSPNLTLHSSPSPLPSPLSGTPTIPAEAVSIRNRSDTRSRHRVYRFTKVIRKLLVFLVEILYGIVIYQC